MDSLQEAKKRLKDNWNQNCIPVVLRRAGKGERLRVRIPFAEDNRQWLQNGNRNSPEWTADKKCWEIPKTWFNDFVNRCLARYGKVYIIQPYRAQEKCSPACQNATRYECQCSCMGEHHGTSNDGSWFEVSDTFASRWGHLDLACRLLLSKSRT